MASSLPPNGLSSANVSRAHSQANDILQKDASRGNVAVHSFDPDAPPEEKAAAAGKARSQLSSTMPSKPGDGSKGRPLLSCVRCLMPICLSFLVEVPVDPGSDGQIPTITIEDVDEQPAKDAPTIPGTLPAAKAGPIPDWYKVGWRAFTDVDRPAEDEDQKQLRIMNAWIPEQYYGQWYYNAAVIIFVRHSTACHPFSPLTFKSLFFSTIINLGRARGTLHSPLQSWLWLALHSLGLV